jgi:hypothetical protein
MDTTGVNLTVDDVASGVVRLATLSRVTHEATFTVTQESIIRITIVCNPSTPSYSNVVIYPMLRYVEDSDSTWQPYAKTNYELTQITANLESEIPTKQSIIQYDVMPIASADNLDNIVTYIGDNTTDFINGHIYKCVKMLNDYKWRDITENPTNYWESIMDYPTYVYNQDKFDDMLVDKVGAM